jgi:putative tricarboxylic transport membrane protein
MSQHWLRCLQRITISAAILVSMSAHALDDIKFMIPGTPGGGFDAAARTMGKALQEAKQAKNVMYENKGGAGGAVGLAQFANASKGDPNALIVTSVNTVTGILQSKGKSPVSMTSATPVARVFTEFNVIAVAAASPFKSMADVMAAMKKDPTGVKWAGGSKGGVDHIGVIEIAQAIGVAPDKVNYSPMGGGGETSAALLGGHVQIVSGGYPEIVKFVSAGHMRLLAVASPDRLAGVSTPTLKEQGLDVTTGNWRIFLGAPGITPAQQLALVEAVTKAIQTPYWKKVAEDNLWTMTPLSGKELDAFIAAENLRWEKSLSLVGLL